MQKVLRRHLNDPLLLVDHVSSEAACPVGTNFLSEIQRVTVSGRLSAKGA